MKFPRLIFMTSLKLFASQVVQGFAVQPARLSLLKQHSKNTSTKSSLTLFWRAKTIICKIPNGEAFEHKVTNRKAMDRLLSEFGVQFLVDESNRRIHDHAGLKNHATYLVPVLAFNYSTLILPLDTHPLRIDVHHPKFICTPDWHTTILEQTHIQMDSHDTDISLVPPIIVACCAEGGSTRTLSEISAALKKDTSHPTCIIYAPFGGYAQVKADDMHDYVRALCLRILFAATREHDTDPANLSQLFEDFRHKYRNYHIDPAEVLQWLGCASVTLIIDDLGNLIGDMSKPDQEANLGNFLADNFLAPAKRSLIVASHGAYDWNLMQESATRKRSIQFAQLPYLNSTDQLLAWNVNYSMTSRDLAYYGYSAGKIWNAVKEMEGYTYNDNGAEAVHAYNAYISAASMDETFINIMRTVICSQANVIPRSLQQLLLPTNSSSYDFIWPLCHLESFLALAKVTEQSWLAQLKHKDAMPRLCHELKDSKNASGGAFESMFTLILLIRAMTGTPDNFFLPDHWTEDAPAVYFNKFNSTAADGKQWDQFKTWEELKPGIEGFSHGPGHKIYVLQPKHAQFQDYDLTAVLVVDGVIQETIGYQLKEYTTDPKKKPRSLTDCAIFVADSKKQSNKPCKFDWHIAFEEHMKVFLASQEQLGCLQVGNTNELTN